MKVLATLMLAASLSVLMASEPLLQLRLKVAAGEAAEPRPAPSVKRLHSGRSHILLEFDPIQATDRMRQLTGRGLRFVALVPDYGVLVTASPDADLDLPGVVRGAPLHPRSKFSPLLRRLLVDRRRIHFLIEFHADTMPWEGRAIALREGLEIQDHPDLAPTHLLVEGTREMATAITQWDEVAYVFPASSDIKNGQAALPSAGALFWQGAVPQYVARVGSGWDGVGKGTAMLTFSYENLSSRLLPEQSTGEIERAMKEWSRVVQVQFRRASDSTAPRNLNFLFARGDYGESVPFDGVGGRLAQSFYPAPPNPEPIAGDIHFDDDEDWNVGVRVDLFSVALHELGHALGLGHSDDPDDVMYPYYRPVTQLSPGDIASIRQMYAPRRSSLGSRRSGGPASAR